MKSGRVLLLEEDLVLRSLLVDALVDHGFEVRTCDSVDELRSAAAAHAADVVVADFWGRSEHVLLPAERNEIVSVAKLLPFVLLTGHGWAADLTAEELGARALIQMPFELDVLLETVAQVARGG